MEIEIEECINNNNDNNNSTYIYQDRDGINIKSW